MKKIAFASLLSLVLTTNIAVASELEDSLKPHLGNLYDGLVAQSETAVKSCHALETALKEQKPRADIEKSFKQLILDWKRVQAIYIISDYDDNAIDIPHYIDVYHRGKEDLHDLMQRALKSSDDAKTTLFKNSFKTVNALEYVLYDHEDELNERQRELSSVITANICNRLSTINAFYDKHKADFLNKPKKAVALIVNELVDSSYKLKEWRIGDPAGLSRKNAGKPHKKYIEYRFSQQSIPAAKAIMEAHTAYTAKRSELAKIITKIAEFDEIEEPLEALENARHYTTATTTALDTLTDADLTSPEKMGPVYKSLSNLNDSYLVELTESMSDVVARVLDSDGD